MEQMKNDVKMIHGKSIFAMNSDDTSVSEMMTMLGVKPETELVMEAISTFNGKFTLATLRDFLVSKNIMAAGKDGQEQEISLPVVEDLR